MISNAYTIWIELSKETCLLKTMKFFYSFADSNHFGFLMIIFSFCVKSFHLYQVSSVITICCLQFNTIPRFPFNFAQKKKPNSHFNCVFRNSQSSNVRNIRIAAQFELFCDTYESYIHFIKLFANYMRWGCMTCCASKGELNRMSTRIFMECSLNLWI